MERGYLALVLHAHLPYVRHPEQDYALEEHWFYEALTETYIPLLLALERLVEDGVEFALTFSLTPTLVSMLTDPLLGSRYLRRLERLIELAEKEVTRTAREPEFHTLAVMYRRLLREARDAFVNRYDRDLVQAWKRLQELGCVEIIASAATHGYLPLLSVVPSAVERQIRVGVEQYHRVFGQRPRGFWLPECGYYPGVDRFLREHGVRYTMLETHGITRADPRPRHGVYAPIYCPSGVAAFGRDPESSKQVWSSTDGYPGDHDYREFYRDIAYDLELDYVKPYIHPDGIRLDTGFKYYRVTGKTDRKEVYVPGCAERKAELHAGNFMWNREKQIEHLASVMDRPPVVVAPYDAELFGHWWFEGPRFLEHLIRKIAVEQETIRLVTLSEYLELYPVNQVATPATSSWGYNGFHEVWLNESNDWIWPHLHRAAEAMNELIELIGGHPPARGVTARARDQALRELLLAQASDWAFMINAGSTAEYGARRTRTHLRRFYDLHDRIKHGEIDEEWLAEVENQDNLFARLEPGSAQPAKTKGTVVNMTRAVGRKRPAVRTGVTRFAEDDLYLFNQGSHFRVQDLLGAHPMTVEGVKGVYFAVWAPNAEIVAVIGDFNHWDGSTHLLSPRDNSGIWEGFIPEVGKGSRYKFHVASRYLGYRADKADPFAFFCEVPPDTASVVWDLAYEWGDQEW
ncbi:MAG: 1,4-alpha-glucan branching protein domain-containing protein, partial [Actinomycetota bacterium]